MRQSDVVRRSQGAARRAMADHASVEQQREWYHSELEASIGPRFGSAVVAPERVGIVAALTTPTALLFLVLLAFVATLGTLLWRDGKLDSVIATAQKRIVANSGYAPRPEAKPWVLGSDNAGAAGEEPPEAPPATPEQPNEMEAALEAARIAALPPPAPVETP